MVVKKERKESKATDARGFPKPLQACCMPSRPFCSLCISLALCLATSAFMGSKMTVEQ